jgi:hypothetical protein
MATDIGSEGTYEGILNIACSCTLRDIGQVYRHFFGVYNKVAMLD